MIRLIKREQCDLVYGNNASGRSRDALIASRLTGRPFVWHFREIKWHWGWGRGLSVRWADAVVAVSHACAESVRRFTAPGRLHVVHNGVDASAFVTVRSDARRSICAELDLSANAKVVITVSHVLPRKAIVRAIEVFAELRRQVPNAHLLVAGSLNRKPTYTAEVRDLIGRFELRDSVHLLGLRSDVRSLLAGSDVCLHTATRDPHPRAVLEAMAAGLPVVAHPVDGVRETIVDGESGYLREVHDTQGLATVLRQLLEDPQRRHAIGQAARRHITSHFSASATADRVAGIIDRVLAERSRGRSHRHETPARVRPMSGAERCEERAMR